MSKVSRRTFIKQVSMGAAGVAAVGALGAGPAGAVIARSQGYQLDSAEDRSVEESEPIVAYVRDRGKGDVTILVGHREIARRDPELARRLLRAAR